MTSFLWRIDLYLFTFAPALVYPPVYRLSDRTNLGFKAVVISTMSVAGLVLRGHCAGHQATEAIRSSWPLRLPQHELPWHATATCLYRLRGARGIHQPQVSRAGYPTCSIWVVAGAGTALGSPLAELRALDGCSVSACSPEPRQPFRYLCEAFAKLGKPSISCESNFRKHPLLVGAKSAEVQIAC